MERILLLAVMPVLLLAQTPGNTTVANTPLITNSTPTSLVPENKNSVPLTPIKLAPEVTWLNVSWDKTNLCQGSIVLSVGNSNFGLCESRVLNKFSKELCEGRRCGKFLSFSRNENKNGYVILENYTLNPQTCGTISNIICEANNELVAYKLITALLLTLVLAVLLFRFARPMYSAFRKRFLKKPENRWIGPTQSQSVSYHRGQGGHLKPDTGKRQSYPGLELPSSNRNSEYDSYSYS